MKQNIKVEAEHNELILENSHGDKVIIPANKRNWVKQKLSEGCHDCIDSLVETLPIASQYAQDGSLYPPNTKVKVNQDNQIKEYDISSPEYRDLYNTGRLVSYDKTTDTYSATPLEEVVITAEAPQWLKDKRKYESQYTKDWYIDNKMPKFSRSMGVSATNMHSNNVKEYDDFINNKIVEDIFKRKPTFETDYSKDRLKTLQGFSQKELELIKNSKYAYRIEPSIWSKFEQGLLSVGNTGSSVQFKNPSLSQEEAKKEDNPLNILQPLSIPTKMVQSAYKDNYSLKDALKGKKNNAGLVEDIVTDPLNLVGAGLVGKLSKADKAIDAIKAGSKVLNKADDVVKNASLIPNWTVPKIKSVEEIDKLDNLHPVFKTFDKDTWKEIAKKKGNDYFLDRFNKQLVNVTNDLNSYENLHINISDYPQLIEGKKWSEDFIKSPEWKQRVKNANPDLTDEQINNLQKSTLLSMPSNMKTFIKNQASKNSFHGGQFTVDDLIHGRNVAFRYFTPEEVLDHPLHFKSLASHEFGHSQSSMRKLPNDKSWHQPLEESGDMMKTNDTYKGDRYVELSEEKRARSIPSYMFAKENNLLENGEFTEKTYDVLKNMAEKDWKSVPNDFNSILEWYNKKSAINYLNKFYATIPFYLYLQSQKSTRDYSKVKAKDGIRGKFTKGSQWEIVKDLKGYPSHSQGGVDIKLGKNGFSFTRNNGVIEAKHGLVLPKIK